LPVSAGTSERKYQKQQQARHVSTRRQKEGLPTSRFPLHKFIGSKRVSASGLAEIAMGLRVWTPLALLLGIVGGIYLTYGAVTPCGILKQKIKAAHYARLAKQHDDLSAILGMTLGNTMVDNMVESLTPMQCLKALRRGDLAVLSER
jgi:hypothetical protein